MKTRRKTVLSLVAMLTLVVGLVMGPLVSDVEAGTMDDVLVYFSTIEGGVSGGVEIMVVFTPNQSIATDGVLKLTFDNTVANTWCVDGADLVITATTSNAVDTTHTALPEDNSFVGTCAGSTSGDTITITSVGALTGGTQYGVHIEEAGTPTAELNTAAAGSHEVTVEAYNGQTIDASTVGFDTVADATVVVSATVASAPTITCTVTGATVNLGTLYQGGAYQTGTNSIGTTTSDAGIGWYWTVYGTGNGTNSGLNNGGTLIPTSNSTVDMTDGSSHFGIKLSGDGNIPADFSSGTATTFGGIGTTPGFDGARMVVSDTTQASGASNTVTYGAVAGSAQATGAYSETVTFSCGAYY